MVVQTIYAAMAENIGTLPPSPAMAGVYAANDAVRGVWNAPANVNGTLRVQITMAMVHPAEFIVITIQQQVQGGAP